MEATAAITVVEGDAPLPADFVEARQVLSASGRPIRAMALQQLAESNLAEACGRLGYAIVGNRIKPFPAGSYGLTMIYYRKIPPLTAENPVNWLLERAPDVYLYGLVEEIARQPHPPGPPLECVKALKRLRYTRERAAVQREIDRLQEAGAANHETEIVALWDRKKTLLQLIAES